MYSNIVLHLGTINADNLKTYIKSLVQFLLLTNRHAINSKIQTNETNSKTTLNAEAKKQN